MSVTSFFRKFQQKVASRVDENPAVWLPFQWVDDAGLYGSDSSFFLYRSLPDTFLHDDQALDALLDSLARTLPGRQVHFVLQGWRDVPDISEDAGPMLADFQRQAITAAAPSVGAVLGVELRASGEAKSSVLTDLLQSVDEPLGETIPDFDAYATDRVYVADVLSQLGGLPMQRKAVDFLESWFTRGRVQDVTAIERDDIIVLEGGSSYVEFASAGSLRDTSEAGMLPEFDLDGSAVISLRGTIQKADGGQRHGHGVLMRVSIIYGRMSSSLYQSLPDALLSLPGVSARPLPLRQLAALNETLPCGTQRLVPEHQRLSAVELRALGFTAQEKPGAERGLLVGKGGRVSPNVFHLNPWEGTGVTGLFGQAGAGKTVLCELLATQAYLATMKTVYLSTQPGAGVGFQGLVGESASALTQPGVVNPYERLPSPLRDRLGAQILHNSAVAAGFSTTEMEAVARGGEHGQQVKAGSWEALLRLMGDLRGQAKVLRFWKQHPNYSVLTAASEQGQELPTGVVHNHDLVATPSVLAAAWAVMIYSHAASSQEPAVFFLDDVPPAVASDPIFQQLIVDVAQMPQVAVIFTSQQVAGLGAVLGQVDQRFMFADDGRDVALEVVPELGREEHGWLDEAAPQVSGSEVTTYAGGVYRNAKGRLYRFQVGLLPQKGMGALLRL